MTNQSQFSPHPPSCKLPSPPTRIGFLFNHDHLHQIPHGAPILAELATLADAHPEVELHAFASGSERLAFLKKLLPTELHPKLHWHEISSPFWALTLDRLSGRAIPFERIGTLFKNRRVLTGMNVMVVPETTSLFLKEHFGGKDLRLIYTQHGAGDRAVGFKPSIKKFDHVFVPGEKIRKRMLEAQIIRPDAFSEVGYPKFDLIDLTPTAPLFENDRPTILYNPHCHPALSSWFRDGLRVLEFFYKHREYNLIVAPHVMLFARRAHLSVSPWNLKFRGRIPKKYYNAPNILIDTSSPACIDMTYTRAADIYLGDASSQIYEFLYTPRPAIFLNSQNANWQNNPNFAHWKLGPVINQVHELHPLLKDQSWHPTQYAERQKNAFTATFGKSVKGGAKRAAQAVLDFANRPRPAVC
ncbi:MAG: hypothetical protein ACK5LK_08930 [Chthoniobacterales bacterium]